MATNGIAQGFTREDLDRFEFMLLERRSLLLGDVQALEQEEAREGSDHFGMSNHLADLGSDRAASDLSLGCLETASGEIQEIDEALERIRDSSFGLCETCGTSIARGRLEAIPYARLCLRCKMLDEEA